MTSSGPTPTHVGPLAALAFVAEVAMLVGLGIVGWHLADAVVLSVVLAAALPVAAGVIWGLWCAPRARRRLPTPQRWAVKVTLFSITTVLLLRTEPVPWAGVFGVVTWLVFLASLPADRTMSTGST